MEVHSTDFIGGKVVSNSEALTVREYNTNL
jgi:hypothetical protein